MNFKGFEVWGLVIPVDFKLTSVLKLLLVNCCSSRITCSLYLVLSLYMGSAGSSSCMHLRHAGLQPRQPSSSKSAGCLSRQDIRIRNKPTFHSSQTQPNLVPSSSTPNFRRDVQVQKFIRSPKGFTVWGLGLGLTS